MVTRTHCGGSYLAGAAGRAWSQGLYREMVTLAQRWRPRLCSQKVRGGLQPSTQAVLPLFADSGQFLQARPHCGRAGGQTCPVGAGATGRTPSVLGAKSEKLFAFCASLAFLGLLPFQ